MNFSVICVKVNDKCKITFYMPCYFLNIFFRFVFHDYYLFHEFA